MSARGSMRLAWALLALAGALVATSFVFAALNGFERAYNWGTAAGSPFIISVPCLTFAVVGALIASRRRDNAVGWICLGIGVMMAVTFIAGQYALYALETSAGALPGGSLAAWVGQWDWIVFVSLLSIYLVLLFPNGHLASPRWRIIAWLGAAAILTTAAFESFHPGHLPSYEVENPLEVHGADGLLAVLDPVGYTLLIVALVGAVASMVFRFRRTAPGVERQQLKWFAFAAAVIVVSFSPIMTLSDTAFASDAGRIAQDVVTLFWTGLPLAVAVAILRHRLYDIDVVINRTLVYGSLTATLAATYLGSVLLLQLALNTITSGSSLAVAGSTLAVAGLFRPARARIQEAVDRRFYRRKYDAARTLEGFGARLRDEVALDSLSAELRGVVAETMQPAHMSLWLRGAAR